MIMLRAFCGASAGQAVALYISVNVSQYGQRTDDLDAFAEGVVQSLEMLHLYRGHDVLNVRNRP